MVATVEASTLVWIALPSASLVEVAKLSLAIMNHVTGVVAHI
jgi:hypothetical protein